MWSVGDGVSSECGEGVGVVVVWACGEGMDVSACGVRMLVWVRRRAERGL